MKTAFKASALFALVFVFFFLSQGVALAAPLNYETNRIAGEDRIQTAILLSQEGWTHADTVLLARMDNYPDSLVAVPLSKRLDAPILLTPSNRLHPDVLEEIRRLGATKAILLGGEGAITAQVAQALEGAGLAWERLGGDDRYATAALVAERLGSNGQVILASGENFPDALAIGPYAGITQTPILLVNKRSLPQKTDEALRFLSQYFHEDGEEGLKHVYVIGGEHVIPDGVLSGLTGVTRIAGNDRYDTAGKVYYFTREQLGDTMAESFPLYLVTGEDFPDALVTGALAAKQNTYLFMSAKDNLPAFTYAALARANRDGLTVTLVGGEAALTGRVAGMVAGSIQPPYLLAGLTIVVDPGHGGKDPGAIGATGSFEKDNTLAISLSLADLLRAAGANVILTRSTDVSPARGKYADMTDLEARVAMANDEGADLFVSVHNNSATNAAAYGTETYYSKDNPAADESMLLAQHIQRQIIKELSVFNRGEKEDRGVKEAGFYVLRHTLMPAALVEVAFISNAYEEHLLASDDFRRLAALGIYRGILSYRGY